MAKRSVFAIWICVMVDLSAFYLGVAGHGRLVEPPGRSTMWRYGYDTPANYLDNQLFCGGFQNQWTTQGGKCGPCGDPWQGPRENEAGGAYAQGIIVRYYHPDSVMRVQVQLTAPHKGWFEFRLCDNNNVSRPVTQNCLDEHLLQLADGTGTMYYVTRTDAGMHNIDLQLPKGMTCSQCILQWKYNAGNSWNKDPETGASCIGCGPQEQFYACADIAIENSKYDDSVILSDQSRYSGNLDEGGESLPKTVEEWKESKKRKEETKLIKFPQPPATWAPPESVSQMANMNWWWIWNGPQATPVQAPPQMPVQAPPATPSEPALYPSQEQWPSYPLFYWPYETTTKSRCSSAGTSDMKICFSWTALTSFVFVTFVFFFT